MDVFWFINELIIVLVFIVVVGLGFLVGVMVLVVYMMGVLVKLFFEVVEVIDDGLVEGICVIGVWLLYEVIWVIIFQVVFLWIFFGFYCFEFNVWFVIVFGLIGVGGIG